MIEWIAEIAAERWKRFSLNSVKGITITGDSFMVVEAFEDFPSHTKNLGWFYLENHNGIVHFHELDIETGDIQPLIVPGSINDYLTFEGVL